jgi:hypothetical protein
LLSGWATSGNVPRSHMRRRRAFTTRSRGARRHRRTRNQDLPSEVRELTGDQGDPCLPRCRPGATQASRTTQRTDGIPRISAQARSRTLASADHSPLIPPRIGWQLLGQHPPGGRRGDDLAERLRLVPQAGQVTDAVATAGEHDHQVAQHLTAVIRASTHAEVGAAAKLTGQPSRSDSSPSSAAPTWLQTP